MQLFQVQIPFNIFRLNPLFCFKFNPCNYLVLILDNISGLILATESMRKWLPGWNYTILLGTILKHFQKSRSMCICLLIVQCTLYSTCINYRDSQKTWGLKDDLGTFNRHFNKNERPLNLNKYAYLTHDSMTYLLLSLLIRK